MAETIPEQLNRLKDVLERTSAGTTLPEDKPLLGSSLSDLPLNQKLQTLNIALMQNFLEMLKNRHEQIAISMAVSRYVTFYARKIAPDAAFWTQEINDDVSLQNNLVLMGRNDVMALQARARDNPKVVDATRNQILMAGEFNKRQQRRIDGEHYYDESEAPPAITHEAAETKLRFLRKTQMREAITGIAMLTNRAVFAVQRIHLVKSHILPLFQQAGDPAADSWNNDIEMTKLQAQQALEEAEALHSHLPRMQAFGPALDAIKPKHE